MRRSSSPARNIGARSNRCWATATYKFEYIRMVWPMQEYFNLTWQRISFALTSPQYRQAIWNIWTNRDYTLYGTLTKHQL